MTKAIIFDCFGVLYPVASDVFYQRNAEKFHYQTEGLDELNRQIDLGELNNLGFFDGIEQLTGMSHAEIHAEFETIKILDQEVVTLIKQLKQRYQVALLSNAGEGELDCLERDDIAKLFEVITVSYQLGIVKPDTKIFQSCAESLGREPSECLFIDDGLKNVEGARAAGMQAVQYTGLSRLKADLEQLLGAV